LFALVCRSNKFLGQRAALAFIEEEAIHLFYEKLLRLARPGLEPVLV